MIELALTDERAEVLRSVLESDLADLSYEIANTDRQDYREMLKQRRDALAAIRRALGEPEHPPRR